MQHQIHGKLPCNRERYIKNRNAVQTEDIVKKTHFNCKLRVFQFPPNYPLECNLNVHTNH